jgi:hypothetical protein
LVYSKSNKNISGNDKLGLLTSTNYSSKKEISDKNLINFNFNTVDGPNTNDKIKENAFFNVSIPL